MTNRSVVDAVRDDIKKLPSELRESGLAASALTLAERLYMASPRDSAGLAKELRTTLELLQIKAGEEVSEEHPIESLRKADAYLPNGTN